MKVIEVFSSIQGEGRFIGSPTVFVRLAGCNMRCSWCDTKDSWGEGEEKSIDELVSEVLSYNFKNICITGGEPMLQKEELLGLIKKLKSNGCSILLETNGSLYDKEIFTLVDSVALDMKPPSSGEKSDYTILDKLGGEDFVKVVVSDESDFEFAKEIISKSPVEVYLQPTDSSKLGWLTEKALNEKLSARVLPQLHKILGVN